MASLIYSMITSLDGYAEAAEGDLGTGAEDPEVHTFIGDAFRHVGTFLFGRRMYETMVFWEDAPLEGEPAAFRDYASVWRAADKVVYSRTLGAASSARTRIEPSFDVAAIRALKASTPTNISIGGGDLAAQALRAGLVDELHLFVFPVVVGGGKRILPPDVRLSLSLIDERRFSSGVVHLHYGVGTAAAD